tara:strand:- start:9 stop:275 length:267 start_codon:yes stop_codon:yes gene_type:complete
LLVLKSIKSVIAIENIRIGTKRGNVKILVRESLLFFEIVIEAVMEAIKIILRSDRDKRILICIKYDKSIFKIIKISGEKIKKKIIKFK